MGAFGRQTLLTTFNLIYTLYIHILLVVDNNDLIKPDK